MRTVDPHGLRRGLSSYAPAGAGAGRGGATVCWSAPYEEWTAETAVVHGARACEYACSCHPATQLWCGDARPIQVLRDAEAQISCYARMSTSVRVGQECPTHW